MRSQRRRCQPDDGTNLGSEAPFVPVSRVVAEFEIRAVEKGAFVGARRGEQQTNLAAIDFGRSAILGDAVQRQVKPCLEPVRHAISPFRDAVERLIRIRPPGNAGVFRPSGGEVIVQDEIEHAGPATEPSYTWISSVWAEAAGTITAIIATSTLAQSRCSNQNLLLDLPDSKGSHFSFERLVREL